MDGGFILISFDTAKADLGARYFYTDLYIWLAFDCRIIRRTHRPSQEAVENCTKEIQKGIGSERVRVPRAMLLEVNGPEALLALSGLHSRAAFTWKHYVCLVANHERPSTHPAMPMPMPRPLIDMKSLAAEQIRSLVRDRDLVDGF